MKPEMAGVAVTNVDARSLIPVSHVEKSKAGPGKAIRSRRRSVQPKDEQVINRARQGQPGKQSALNNDLKHFHQQQAQQYKEYVKKSGRGGPLGSRLEQGVGIGLHYHDQSLSTLLDQGLEPEAAHLDDLSMDLKPV